MRAFKSGLFYWGLLIGSLLSLSLFINFKIRGVLSIWEAVLIGCLSLILFGLAAWIRIKKQPPNWLLFTLFNLLTLVSIELFTRYIVFHLLPESSQQALKFLGERNSKNERTFVGHPFVQYIGNPLTNNGTRFNSLGFRDEEFVPEKDSHTYRIVAIGGSTTENGYPNDLERYLNQNRLDCQPLFEVYNFGISGWTSAHSLNNFVLNVLDYSADAVLIHHGWNDEVARNALPEKFRSDYSHAFVTMGDEYGVRQTLIRSSMVYRILDWLLHGLKSRDLMNAALTIDQKRRFVHEKMYSNLAELKPFIRNTNTIIDLAKARDMDVILTTMPYNLDTTLSFHETIIHLDQCNGIMRDLSREDSSLIFIDLDNLMTNKYESYFIDLGHLNDSGRAKKAELVGRQFLPKISCGVALFN